ncbi:hypothetical protein HRbin33_02560 [bacterium HR33]|nr:hypothetical protein HRbin33_02560 [bacterium HR33]
MRFVPPVSLAALVLFWGGAIGSLHDAAAQETTAALPSQVPHPREVLGFEPGEDYRLADYSQMLEYFQRVDRSSPRVRLEWVGTSTEGRPMFVAVITSEENFGRLDRYREIARKLASARGLTPQEARELAREGKAIVWIDSGLHSLETGPAQHAFLLAYKLASEDSEAVRRILDNVILVLMPCVEPDGLDRVVSWYRRTVHTEFQDSPMPWLFNRYSGYDNNRDYFMQTQVETQIVSRLLYFDWLPQIVYNHHQGFYPARIFVPPFPDPFNPNIDPGVLRGIELVGAAMQYRFEREGKDGVLSRYGFSSWYNGSLRTTSYFHNMIGILSETTHDTPTPFFYDPDSMPSQFGNGWSTREPSTSYPRPWRGGWIRFREVLDYMLTGSMAVLDVAARYREELLYGVYQIAARQIALGATEPPIAYVIPLEQHDPPVASKLVEVLLRGGVEVHRATAPFAVDGRSFSSGSYVIFMAQPFRPFVKDLLEPQRHPDVRVYPGGPPIPPYDNAGWTLSYQMGVTAVPVAHRFDAALELVERFPRVSGSFSGRGSYGYAVHPRTNNTVIAVNRLLSRGFTVLRAEAPLSVEGQRWPAGAVVVPEGDGLAAFMKDLVQELGLEVRGLEDRPRGALSVLRQPRVGVYKSYVTEWVDDWTAAEGWTRYLFDNYEIPYTSLFNADIRRGNLSGSYDVILIPDQAVEDIIGGYRAGRRQFELPHQALPPPEYRGGIESDGVQALEAFVREGGTLILVDRACDLATREMKLEVRNVLEGLSREEFFGPGSIVRIEVDPDHPLGYGMPAEAYGYFRKSRAFEVTAPRASVAVRYSAGDVLASGWLLGENFVRGRAAVVEVPHGRGRVVLLGFSPYFRAQPHGTFKLLFNAIYSSGVVGR